MSTRKPNRTSTWLIRLDLNTRDESTGSTFTTVKPAAPGFEDR